MIFYVYLDPAVIPSAQAEGPYALQVLIAALRGFLQNCLVVDFEDYRLQEAMREQVAAMPPNFDRKLIKSILTMLSKHNRFVYCLAPDYVGSKSDHQLLMEQAAAAMIDLALLAAEHPSGIVAPPQMEVTTLATYQHSEFEMRRSRIAGSGKRTIPGEMSARDFMDFHFRKALRFATKIELCDRAFGKYYGDNYEYTLREFFRWLEPVLANPDACEVDLHCELPEGKKSLAVEGELRAGKRGRLAALTIRVHYYDGSGFSDSLPHERFIRTEQVALSIDRGLDFLDKSSRANRDVFITGTDPDECQSVLNHFAGKRVGDPKTI